MAIVPVPIPAGLDICSNKAHLTTFIEMVNVNFMIFTEEFNEIFEENVEIPGVPPTVVDVRWDYLISPIAPWAFRISPTGVPSQRAWIGNRFPAPTGGTAPSIEGEIGGSAGARVTGKLQFVVPGTDPVTQVLQIVQTNYNIIQELMEERGLVPALFAVDFISPCLPGGGGKIGDHYGGEYGPAPQVNHVIDRINQNNQNLGGPNDGLGSPLGDCEPTVAPSEIPGFGPCTGSGLSCWQFTDDVTLVDNGDGTHSPRTTNTDPDGSPIAPGPNGTITLKCACTLEAGPATGTLTVGATTGNIGGPPTGGLVGYAVDYLFYSDANCTILSGAILGVRACGFSGGTPDTDISCPAQADDIQGVNPGDRVVIRIRLFAENPGSHINAPPVGWSQV